MPTLRAFLILTVFSAGSVDAQSRARPSVLEGVWQRVEQIRFDQTSHPAQPGLRIFSGGHYSWTMIVGEDPRPPLRESATAQEVRAAWDLLIAETGTFQVVGETITQRPLVAKDPAQMDPSWFTALSFRIIEDTLYLAQVENPSGMLLGMQPAGKYVRVR